MYYQNQLVNTGKLSDVGYPEMSNVEKSYRTGIEIENEWKITDFFSWNINVTFSQNKILNYAQYEDFYDSSWNYIETKEVEMGNTNISYSPSFVGANVFKFNIKKFITFSFSSKYVSKQFIDNTNSEYRKLNPYFVSNFQIASMFKLKEKTSIEITFIINNLFNAKYSSNGYGGADFVGGAETSWVYYYPQAPTHFMLKTALHF
ncbi:MAG: hypothetical protein IPO21_18615 [Bacteroidales bacterium]|nr:hypothetical protein [Bacteroidales bacterium]